MLRSILAGATIALCLVAVSALAQPNSAGAPTQVQTLPAVDTMTCDQMQAELTTSGMQMHNQLDPQFGVEANAMAQEAQEKQRQAQQQAMNPACFIPFVGMACAAQQQQQAQQAQADAPRQQARMQAQMDRLNNSMSGLDQQRLQALSQRFEAQHCQSQSPAH